MVKRGYNAVYGLGHFWTRDHEIGKVKLKVQAKIAKAMASGRGAMKQSKGEGEGGRLGAGAEGGQEVAARDGDGDSLVTKAQHLRQAHLRQIVAKAQHLRVIVTKAQQPLC